MKMKTVMYATALELNSDKTNYKGVLLRPMLVAQCACSCGCTEEATDGSFCYSCAYYGCVKEN